MLRLFVPVVVLAALLAPSRATTPESEIERLQRHFATVERELLARDVSHLTPAQRAARARHVERLRAYAGAGVFPKNTDFPGRRIPYFIDGSGTRCAMAHLIEQSGSGDYVRRVAGRMNNAYIADIAREPELSAPLFSWLEENGLTVEEAARIQPAYGCNPRGHGGCPPPIPTAPPSYGPAVSNGLTSAALATSLMDWDLSPQTSGWLRVGAGTLGVLVGISTVNRDGSDYDLWGILNMGIGVISVALGVEGLSAPSQPTQLATVGPLVTPEGSAGLRLSVSF